MTLHEVAEVLWVHGSKAAYYAHREYIKERDALLTERDELRAKYGELSGYFRVLRKEYDKLLTAYSNVK